MNKMVFAAALAASALIMAPVTPALAKKPAPIAALDRDNHSTVDLAEVKKSAEGLFDKPDTDKDGSARTPNQNVSNSIRCRAF